MLMYIPHRKGQSGASPYVYSSMLDFALKCYTHYFSMWISHFRAFEYMKAALHHMVAVLMCQSPTPPVELALLGLCFQIGEYVTSIYIILNFHKT
jgi:hypothetical protein